jgi:hypothetical protein
MTGMESSGNTESSSDPAVEAGGKEPSGQEVSDKQAASAVVVANEGESLNGERKNFSKPPSEKILGLAGEGIRSDGTVVADVEAERLLRKYGVERLKKMLVRRQRGEMMLKLAENLAVARMDKGSAYLDAGYEAVNIHVARQGTRRVLEREPMVRALVIGLGEEFLEEMQERYGVEKEKVLREIGTAAFANIDDVATWDQDELHLKASKDLPQHVKAAVKSVKIKYDKNGGVSGREIELHDKLKALELAGKHLKLFGDEGTTNEVRVIVQQVSSVEMGPED